VRAEVPYSVDAARSSRGAPRYRGPPIDDAPQAREVIAAWFPKPDVLPFIRKLPTQPSSATAAAASASPAWPGLPSTNDGAERHRNIGTPGTVLPAPHGVEPLRAAIGMSLPLAEPTPPRLARTSAHLEPLSPGRYKLQLTADAELKRKLDLARDLLRHAVPSGDLATLLGRALDLLIEKTLQRRVGKTIQRKRAAARASTPAASTAADAATPSTPAKPPPERHSHHLPSATRRAALERDGLRCTYRACDGTRCESQAWLEHDHVDPRGQGGSDDPGNIRIRCRAHNRLTAEQTYGRAKMARIRRRRSRKPCDAPGTVIDGIDAQDRSGSGLR
jgi:hypothetical protein